MTSSESNVAPVSWALEGDIGIIRINNPPVNALSQPVRQGILNCLQQLLDNSCRLIILHCEGRTFCAGADIREFNQPPMEPHLPEVVLALYNSPVPIIAALHGTVLGGGLEIAMACTQRTAVQNCCIGLPEVNLGLIPGAGGTQLLPTLTAVGMAVEMITSGKHYPISSLKETALIQHAFDPEGIKTSNDILTLNINYVSHLADFKRINFINEQHVNWQMLEQKVSKAARGRIAPLEALKVLKDSHDMPLENGMALERQVFMALKSSAQSIALRHTFAAEKMAVKFQTNATPADVSRIAVIGAGTMGTGIATALLNADYQIVLMEHNQSQLEKAAESIRSNLQTARQRGLCTKHQMEQRLCNLSTATNLAAVAPCDLVIEAIFEDLVLKIQLLAELQNICRDDCLFASNTSYLDLDKMAESLIKPERLIGLHFFSPAHIMKLLEVVRSKYSSETAIATGFEIGRKARKIPVLVANCFGFAGNRMYNRYGREIQQMLLEGASIKLIDDAMKDFGMAMGPLEVQDMAGIDVGQRARDAQPFPTHDPGYFKASALLVEHGMLGRKTGSGFYTYEQHEVKPNQSATRLIQQAAQALGITAKSLTVEQIQQRALMALISEGYQLVSEGIVSRISDLDVIWVNGYGFPRYRGGPMHMAEQMGAAAVQSQLATLRADYGDKIWPAVQIPKH